MTSAGPRRRSARQCFHRLALLALALGLAAGLADTGAPVARAALAQGDVEEWGVPTAARGSVSELAVGQEGYVWFLLGSFYIGDSGYAEALSAPGTEALTIDLAPNAYGTDAVRGPDGNMWITEEHSTSGGEEPDTIGRLEDHDGVAVLTSFAIKPTESGDFCCDGPIGIANGPNGHLWFTDQRPSAEHKLFIGEMTTDGSLAEHPLPAGHGPNVAATPRPYGIAVGSEGNLWFTDDGTNEAGHNLIGRMTPAGQVNEFPVPTVGAEPAAIALGADGDMWFTEPGTSKIGRITSVGEITEFSVPDVTSALQGLALGPEGKLWFAERESDPGFGSISTSGEVRSYHPSFEPPEGVSALAGPSALVVGPDGTIWFTDPRPRDEFDPVDLTDEGRFAIPLPPSNLQSPAVYGSPLLGSVISASSGLWANDATAETFQWQRCSAGLSSCQEIAGAQSPSYPLSAPDIGSRIRVAVTASNDAGANVAISEPTAPVQIPEVPRQAVPNAQLEVVGATISDSFVQSRHGTAVRALVLHNVKAGSTVQISCRGAGCALARAATRGRHGPCHRNLCQWTQRVTHGSSVNLTHLVQSMRLRHGAQLSVVVTYPGAIGRAFEFGVGRHGVSGPLLSCRTPGSFVKSVQC